MDTYERKYKEALAKAKEQYNYPCMRSCMGILEEIFPELAESEDEKVRKGIIELVKQSSEILNKKNQERMLAWLENIPATIDHEKREGFHLGYKAGLEKQGEQKPQRMISAEAKEALFDYENADIKQKDFAPKEDTPRYSIGDVLCDKSCTTLNKEAQPNFEITDIRNGMYICDKCSFPISQQDEYELVAKRVEQKPAEWSEEDEVKINRIVACLENLNVADNDILLKDVDWLKSLRPQNRWKPSDGQIRFLQAMVNDPNNASSESCQIVLKDILKQLKKLKEG